MRKVGVRVEKKVAGTSMFARNEETFFSQK